MKHKQLSRIIRGLGLCSGGLDSILSALVLKEQNIDVTWISFQTPFFSPKSAIKASKMTGVPLRVVDITDRYMIMLDNPKAGYGKNMNPCMDCHALMFECAGEIMEAEGFDFLFSGEVAGQRPFSQNKRSLRYVEKNSKYDGSILRPLSAKVLPETPMEKAGLVDRERLCDISGRSRKVQIEMAKEFGVTAYPAPAGGCLLTDKIFSIKLKDLLTMGRSVEPREIELLKYGRHIRLEPGVKAVVGRSKADNKGIMNCYRPGIDILIKHASMPSPATLIQGGALPETVQKAASICAGYTKTAPGDPAEMLIRFPEGPKKIIVSALAPLSFRDLLI